MKKNIIRGGVLAGLIGASLMATAAQAAPVTVNFSFLNSAATTIANGSLTYNAPSGTITAFSGFSAFSITFHSGASTDTYTLSQLTGISAANQAVDFNTTTNQFVFAPTNPAGPFFGLSTELGAASGPIDFYIYNQSGGMITDNALNLFHAPFATVTYQTAVPEPATVALFGAGIVGVSLLARRRRQKASKA